MTVTTTKRRQPGSGTASSFDGALQMTMIDPTCRTIMRVLLIAVALIGTARSFAFPTAPDALTTRRAGGSPSSLLPALVGPHVSTTARRQQGRDVGARSFIDSSSVRTAASTSSSADDSSALVSPQNRRQFMITPEGLGFTSPVGRILQLSGRAPGYHRALSTDSVLAVQAAISSSAEPSSYDVALVFDNENPQQLVGLFTEADYVKFSIRRAQLATSEQDSAELLVASVKDYVTPSTSIVALNPDEDAGVAICAMREAGVRHMVVANPVSPQRTLLPESKIVGVVSMQDVMAVLQRDERLSLTSLAKKYPNLSVADQVRRELIESANEAANEEDVAKRDVIRTVSAALFAATLAVFLSQSSWLHDHADWAMIGIFVAGYLGIIFEEVFEFNKAGVALLMSTGLWVTYGDFFQSSGKASEGVIDQLKDQLAEVSDICFFLLAASAIVEVVDAHQGFKAVTDNIKTTSKKALFWIVGVLTFFLSSILNNLTVTIVMVSLLRKLIPNPDDRKLFGAMVVVAANAGGVWTPVGDVTTTMLWINQQLSTVPTITELFLPSTVCLVASLAFLVGQVEEDGSLDAVARDDTPLSKRGQIVFWTGIASLLSVPVFNDLTGLPPYLAMLTGLGVIWTLTDVLHMGEEEGEQLKVPAALARLDTAGILFFLGILMSIGVLDKSGLLKELAVFLSDNLPSLDIIATVIGLASALIDNVPLVAATMGMYDLTEFGTDDKLWQLIALCAGTGGSILVIGSASGVALMGLEKVDFLWYAKKVTLGATVGYFAGIATYLAQYAVLNGGLLTGLLPQAAVAADVLQQSAGLIS